MGRLQTYHQNASYLSKTYGVIDMICEICGKEFVGTWTDFHGEMTCTYCGAPYQMKDYHGAPLDEKCIHTFA